MEVVKISTELDRSGDNFRKIGWGVTISTELDRGGDSFRQIGWGVVTFIKNGKDGEMAKLEKMA